MPKPESVVPASATRRPDGRRCCGALTRAGGRCQDVAIFENGRCRRHAGRAPRGVASPLTKTGRYSRDLPTRVLGRYEAALADPELLSLRDDIALLQGAVADVMAEMRDAEAAPDIEAVLASVERITAEWATWDWTRMTEELARLRALIVGRQSQRAALREIRELVKEKAALVAQENRLLADRQQMITVEQYLLGMRALGSAVRRLVDDPVTLRSIDVEFRRLASVPERGA